MTWSLSTSVSSATIARTRCGTGSQKRTFVERSISMLKRPKGCSLNGPFAAVSATGRAVPRRSTGQSSTHSPARAWLGSARGQADRLHGHGGRRDHVGRPVARLGRRSCRPRAALLERDFGVVLLRYEPAFV